MKKLFISLLFALLSNCIFSQSKPEFSEAFKEPEGWTKLIQIRNGNTALIEITKRKGMNFTLYGPDRKVIVTKLLPLTKVSVKMGGPSSVPAIYDIDGNVVLFVLFFADSEKGLVPTLFRVVVDGKTGNLIEESSVLALKEFTMEDNNELAYGEKDYPAIHVEKDPESDNYAVIGYNVYLNDLNKVLNVLHFDGSHKLISNNFVTVPKGNYKYINYLGAYVHKDEYVITAAYVYNAGKGSAKEIKYFSSKLTKDNAAAVLQELKYQDYSRDAKGKFIYNKNKLTLIITALNKLEGDDMGYDISFQTINPATLAVENLYKDDLTKVNEYYKTKMNGSKDIWGYVGGTSVTSDGNLLMLYQNIAKRTISPTVGASRDVHNNYDYTNIIVPVSKWTVRESFLGDLGISVMSPEGKVIESKAINFAMLRSGNLHEFGYDDRKKGRKGRFELQDPGLGAPWYFGADVVSTESGNYIFCNASAENFEKPDTERHGRVKAISTTNAVKYVYKNGTISKGYLFDAPKDKKENKFCNFSASDYNPVTKTYSTIMVDVKAEKSSVVWFKLD
ncbi:MAG: hypothetical protein KA163_01995 [Bacteroidia bacterium]|nr:hypothetical protein [Bacteroidia bacterium]